MKVKAEGKITVSSIQEPASVYNNHSQDIIYDFKQYRRMLESPKSDKALLLKISGN